MAATTDSAVCLWACEGLAAEEGVALRRLCIMRSERWFLRRLATCSLRLKCASWPAPPRLNLQPLLASCVLRVAHGGGLGHKPGELLQGRTDE
jgi:hypothetical protein